MHHDEGSLVRFRFKGAKDADGIATEHLEGLPARSLTGDEYDALPAEDRKRVRESAIYVEVERKPAASKADKATDETAPAAPASPAKSVKE